MPLYEIQCGDHYGEVEAPDIQAAWRKLTKKKRTGFSMLARFRRVDIGRRQRWEYITPQALDR